MIRPLKVSDAEALVQICYSALEHTCTPELLRRRIQQLSGRDEYFLAAFEDTSSGEPVGFIQAQKYELLYGADGWNIIALAVLPEHQHQGIGKALLAALEEHARKGGFTFIRLNSRIERP